MGKISPHREWRGPGDTLMDYIGWLCLWVHILTALPKAPEHTARFFLRLPTDVDAQLTGLRGFPFRCCRKLLNVCWKRRLSALRRGKAVFLDSSVPTELMAGFPELTYIPLNVRGRSVSCPAPPDSGRLYDCIRQIEVTTNEKFDWDAFFTYYRRNAALIRTLESCCDGVCLTSSVNMSSPKAALESIARHFRGNFSEK